MFRYNIPENLMQLARKELRKDIHSRHPIVRRFERQVEKISWKHAGYVWLMSFFGILFITIFLYAGQKSYFRFFDFLSTLFILLLLPTIIAAFAKNISICMFCKKYRIPNNMVVSVSSSCSSSSFSKNSSPDSSTTINPANGYSMCGSVDVNGNLPGHQAHRY